MGWARELIEWHARRRRFAQEWAFHRDLATREFESFGLSHREARQLAKRRLGSRSVHRRSALRHLRADYSALFELVPWYRLKVSPFLGPAIVMLVLTVLLAIGPHPLDVLSNSISLLPFTPARHVERFVPLAPSGVVPMGFADVTLWCFALIGMARIAATPKLRVHWRAWTFAVATLFLVIALGAVLWATGLQLLMQKRWASDTVQGAAIVTFPFAYVGWAFVALRIWYRDLLGRCPVCLRRLGMADLRGNANDLLIAPLEKDTVCLRGHGANVESRWKDTFESGQFTASPI